VAGVRKSGAWLVTVGVLVAFILPVPAAQAAQSGLVATAGASRGGTAQSAGSGDALLDVVMLVDESGSETGESVAQERQVAATIGQSMLNPASRITVVGFGGVNHMAPDQNPINVACQPTIASGAKNLAYLSVCPNSLNRRSEAEGDDTDYAAALGQAMSYLNPDTTYGQQSPPGALKVILMMTDGGVDVHRDTQQYGQDWLAGVHQAVNEQLALARQDHVEVWTLGMGTDINATDQQYLQYLAAHGAQSTCLPAPHSTLVTNRADALAALNQLYAQAGCLGTSVSPWIPLTGGGTGSLQVTIPAIASNAAISVDRGDPGVQVSFYQPDGTLWANSSAVSGEGSAVDVLHLANPAPGTWKIKLTAPPGLKSELVSATAFWQGAVRALITANPPSAQPGQAISVSLSVLGNNGPVTDPTTIKNLHVGVTVSGDGVTQATPVTVSNAGENNSSGTGVANYTGTFQAPKTTGTLTFTGTAQGYGLYATDVPASVQVSNVGNGFGATVQFPTAVSVQAGSGLQGQVIFRNTTGAAKTVRLALSNVSNALATITSPGGPVTVPSGNPPQTSFTISFASNSPAGSAWLTLMVVDAANPSIVYADAPLNITVTKPPGFIAKYLWVIIGILALIALIILAWLLLRAARRARVDVRSLRAEISRDGEPKGKPLRPLGNWSDTFTFVIRDEDNEYARLELPQPGSGDPTYVAKRGGPGEIRVWTPAGQQHDTIVGSAGELLPNGLRLGFRDTRKRGSGRSIPGIPGPGQKKKSSSARPQSAAYPPATPPADDWGSPYPSSPLPTQPAVQMPTQPAPQVSTPQAPPDKDDWM
jgi:hypothetical protein